MTTSPAAPLRVVEIPPRKERLCLSSMMLDLGTLRWSTVVAAVGVAVLGAALLPAGGAEPVPDPRLEKANKTLEKDPNAIDALALRAQLLAARREFVAAVRDWDRLAKLQPDNPEFLYHRGRSRFCAGQIDGAVEDFDEVARLQPKRAPSLWERGIALYYAGKFHEGAEQFASYQTFDSHDVENATWRFLCMARDVGADKARAELLPIEGDARIPMKQIYELYRGAAKPADVLAAAEAGDTPDDRLNAQLFYAHLYLGLYYEAIGQPKEAKEHIVEAEKRQIGHYMWDVAHVHAERLRAAKK